MQALDTSALMGAADAMPDGDRPLLRYQRETVSSREALLKLWETCSLNPASGPDLGPVYSFYSDMDYGPEYADATAAQLGQPLFEDYASALLGLGLLRGHLDAGGGSLGEIAPGDLAAPGAYGKLIADEPMQVAAKIPGSKAALFAVATPLRKAEGKVVFLLRDVLQIRQDVHAHRRALAIVRLARMKARAQARADAQAEAATSTTPKPAPVAPVANEPAVGKSKAQEETRGAKKKYPEVFRAMRHVLHQRVGLDGVTNEGALIEVAKGFCAENNIPSVMVPDETWLRYAREIFAEDVTFHDSLMAKARTAAKQVHKAA